MGKKRPNIGLLVQMVNSGQLKLDAIKDPAIHAIVKRAIKIKTQ